MEISGIHLDCSAARSMISEAENEICNLVLTMQDEARKKGFVTVEHDGKKLRYYLNAERKEGRCHGILEEARLCSDQHQGRGPERACGGRMCFRRGAAALQARLPSFSISE